MPSPGRPRIFSDFARQRDLWWQFTVRTVEMRHRGSHLGFLWSVLNPLLMVALYVTVFGVIFKGRFHASGNESALDYALGVFLGLIFFHALAETMAIAPTLIIGNSNLVKKVVFPLEILPLSQAGSLWFHALISFGLFFIGQRLIGHGFSLRGLCWLPLILAPNILLNVGLGLFLSALGVFFRDITQVTPFLSQVILYASAIFYPVRIISPPFWAFLKWNPLLQTAVLARDALLWGTPVSLTHLAYTWVVGAACLVGGIWFFRITRPSFAEVL